MDEEAFLNFEKNLKEKNNDEILQILLNPSVFESKNNEGTPALFYPISYKNLYIASIFATNTPQIDIADSQGKTAFHYATEIGFDHCLDILFYNDCNLNAKNGLDQNALFYALKFSQWSSANKLLKWGIEVNIQDKEGMNPLLTLASIPFKWPQAEMENNSNLKFKIYQFFVEYFLREGIDINQCNLEKQSPLQISVGKKNKELTTLLIQYGADINYQIPATGNTPLMNSVPTKSIHLTRLLIEEGADLLIKNKKNQTALMLAEEYGNKEAMEILKKAHDGQLKMISQKIRLKPSASNRDAFFLERGNIFEQEHDVTVVKGGVHELDSGHILVTGKVEQKSDQQDFYRVSSNQNEEGSEEIVRVKGTGPEGSNATNSKWNVIHTKAAKDHEHEKAAKFNPNARNDKGVPLLSQFCSQGKIEQIKILIDQGADCNIKDFNSKTPLMYAAISGQTQTAKFLVENGAKVNERDEKGQHAFNYALLTNQFVLAQYLIDVGSKTNYRMMGLTPLMMATSKKFYESAVLLVNAGADPWEKNSKGQCAYDIAKTKNYQEFLKLFDPLKK